MPLPLFAKIALTQIGIGTALLLLAGSGRRGRRRQQQIRRAVQRAFGEINADIQPYPILYGRHRKYAPQLIYAQRVLFDHTLTFGGESQPGQGKRLLLAYLVSRGACNRLRGVWVDGTYRELSDRQRTEDDDGFVSTIPNDGKVYEYFAADGTGGAQLRRETTRPYSGTDEQQFRDEWVWTADDRLEGYSWVLVTFDALPRVDADTPEAPFVLAPTTSLSRYPSIELDVEGRRIPIPAEAPRAAWQKEYTEETSAVISDILVLAGQEALIDDEALRESHLIGNATVTVHVPGDPGDPDAEEVVTLFWIVSDDKPPRPTAFDATTQGWSATVPIGGTIWVVNRTGTSDSFSYSEPRRWNINTPSDPDISGAFGFSGPGTTSGLDPNIDQPEIGTASVSIVVPPGSTAQAANPVVDDTASIRYPCSVLLYSDELNAQDLGAVLNRLSFNFQGRVLHHAGRILVKAGYARTPLAVVADRVHGDFVEFNPSGPDTEQWNTYSIALPTGDDGSETEQIDLRDEARILRAGIPIRLRLGEQPYVNDSGHARRMLAITAVRRRYQRSGTFVLRPDADLEWLPHVEPGQRIQVTSDTHQLESHRLRADGAIETLGYTTFYILNVTENPDRSVSLTVEEDPDIVWRDYVSLPPVDPDVSEPGITVNPPQNLQVDERFKAQLPSPLLYMRASWTPSSEPTAEIEWRPVVLQNQTLTLETNGGTVTLSETPAWGSAYTSAVLVDGSVPYADFGVGSTYWDVLHDVRVRFRSARGVPSVWSYASIIPSGNRNSPDRPRGLGVREFRDDSGFEVSWVPAPEDDYWYTAVRLFVGADDDTVYDSPGVIERQVVGNAWTWQYDSGAVQRQLHRLFVVHVNTSGNESITSSIDFLPSGFGADRFRSYAFTLQPKGTAPDTPLSTLRTETELATAGYDSLPAEPPSGQVCWYVESALFSDEDGAFTLERFGPWSDPIPFAVASGESITHDGETFNTSIDLEGQYLDGIGGKAAGASWDGSLSGRSAFKNGLNSGQPILDIRRRVKLPGEQFKPWDGSTFVHRWIRYGILTPTGAVYGHKANLYTETATGTDPEPPAAERRIAYQVSTATSVSAPTTYNPSSPWSFTDPRPVASTAQTRYLWQCERVATSSSSYSWGQPSLLFRISPTTPPVVSTETLYKQSNASSAPASPPNSMAVGAVPTGFRRAPADPFPAQAREWRWTRTITDGTAGNWSAAVLFARRHSTTIYYRGNTLRIGPRQAANAGSRLQPPAVPPGWSTSLIDTRPTAAERHQWRGTVFGNALRSTQTTLIDSIADWDTGTIFYRRGTAAPALPNQWNPPGWTTTRLAPTATESTYKTTRSGWSTTTVQNGQPTGHEGTFTPVVVDRPAVGTPDPPLPKQTVYALAPPTGVIQTPTNTSSDADLTSPAGACGQWNQTLASVRGGLRRDCPLLYAISREDAGSGRYGNWGVGSGNGLRLLHRWQERFLYSSHPRSTSRVAVTPTGTGDALGQNVVSTALDGSGSITHTVTWHRVRSLEDDRWQTAQAGVLDVVAETTAWGAWSTPVFIGRTVAPPPDPTPPEA